MLLSDGSVTRHLQLLTDAKVKVDVLRQQLLRSRDLVGDPAVPDDVLAKLFPGSLAPIAATEDTSRRGGPRLLDAKREISSFRAVSDGVLHREVDLCDGTDGAPLVYASSWWTVEAARKFGILKTDGGATERAVWMHLSDARTELYREVRRVYRGESTELERAWGVPDPSGRDTTSSGRVNIHSASSTRCSRPDWSDSWASATPRTLSRTRDAPPRGERSEEYRRGTTEE